MKKYLTLPFAFLLFFLFSTTVSANDFVVKPTFSQKQRDLTKSYFYESANPGEKKQFSIQIKNENEIQSTFIIRPTDAFSNPFSFMEYSDEERTSYSRFLDERYRFTRLFNEEKIFKMNPGETKNILFEATIPKDLKVGQILGAFQVEEIMENEKTKIDSSKEATFDVHIKKRFTIGVLLNITEPQNHNVVIENVEAKIDGKLPKIFIQIHNKDPFIVDNLEVTYKVYSKYNRLLFEKKEPVFSLAPSTTLNLPLKWLYKDFKAGDYRIEASLSSTNDKDFYVKYKNDFSISQVVVNEFVDTTETEPFFLPKGVERFPLIYFNIAIFVIVGVIYYWKRKRNKRKEKDA